MCSGHDPPLKYSSHWLRSRSSFTSITHCLHTELYLSGISRNCPKKKNNRRGTRGGRKKQRKINTVISNRSFHDISTSHDNIKGACIENLTYVSTNSLQVQSKHFKVISFNAQSCRNKTHEIHDLILDSDCDLVFMTETWLKESGDDPLIKELVPSTFDILFLPRLNRTGGGVAIIYKRSLKIQTYQLDRSPKSFEYCSLKVMTSDVSLYCACVYRPTRSEINRQSVNVFLEEFNNFLDSINKQNKVHICGDINIHVDNIDDPSSKKLKLLLDDHHLKQIIDKPTQRCGHTLDLVIIRDNDTSVSAPLVDDICLSDHFVISYEVCIEKPSKMKQIVISRNLKKVDVAAFKSCLQSSVSSIELHNLSEFNSSIIGVLDRFAPLTKRLIPCRPFAPWVNDLVKKQKQKKRQAERVWKRTGLTVHKEIYKKEKVEIVNVVRNEKKNYISEKIASNNSSRELFKICNDMLGKDNDFLPNTASCEELPSMFNSFFIDKIDSLRKEMDKSNATPSYQVYDGERFSYFKPVSTDFVKKIITESPQSFCQLDPLPATLFSECIDILLPFFYTMY